MKTFNQLTLCYHQPESFLPIVLLLGQTNHSSVGAQSKGVRIIWLVVSRPIQGQIFFVLLLKTDPSGPLKIHFPNFGDSLTLIYHQVIFSQFPWKSSKHFHQHQQFLGFPLSIYLLIHLNIVLFHTIGVYQEEKVGYM